MTDKLKIEELQQQIENLRKQADDYLNGWKRAKADLINYQKQVEREREEWLRFSQTNFARAILPMADSLENALESGIINQESGLQSIRNQFISILKDLGVEEIKGIGEPANPELHEVVGKEKSEIYAPGLIIKEVQRGYLLNGKVLRSSKVIISE